MSDVFTTLLDNIPESDDTIISSILYETEILRKVLDTAREGSLYTLKQSGKMVSLGCMPFIRKIANKLAALSNMSDEVYSFLESIPEWKDYFENDLAKQNAIEAKPLGADPRKGHCSDDFIDLMFKMNKPDDTTNQENDDELESIEDD